MTVVGSVSVEVLALVDSGRIARDMETPLNRAAAKAGDRVGASFGRAIGAGVNKTASAAGTVFGTLFSRTTERTLEPLGYQVGAHFGRDVGDGAGRELTKTGRQQGLTFGKLVGAGLTAGLGTASLYGGFRLLEQGLLGSLSAAGELDAAVGRSRTTFGAASGAVEAFAKDSQRNLLLTRQQVLTTSDAFGEMLRGAGVGEGQSAGLSTKLVGLAQDLAALNHVGVDKTLAALQSGLEGNSGALRQFQVDLSPARVQAEAFALGIAKPVKDAAAIRTAQIGIAAATQNLAKVQFEHGKGTLASAQAQDRLDKATASYARALAGQQAPLTNAQLVQARVALTLKDTERAQGGAARSSGDYAVTSQHLRTQLAGIATDLGVRVMPRVEQGERAFSRLIDEFHRGVGTGGDLRDELSKVGRDVKALGDDFRPVLDVVMWFVDHPKAMTAAVEGMALYAAYTKSAAIWSKRIVPIPPAAAGAGAAAGAEAAGGGAGILATLFGWGKEGAAAGARNASAVGRFAADGIGRIPGLPLPALGSTLLPKVGSLPTLGGDGYWHNERGTYTRDGAGNFHPLKTLPTSGRVGPDRAETDFLNRRPGRHAVAAVTPADAAKAAADQAEKDTKYAEDQYAAFQQALADAITKATDAAREQGEKVTEALQGQLEVLRQSQARVEAQGRKISDFRSQVLGQVGAFSAITGLLPDNSLATAGGIGAQLQNRLRADTLFASNLATLGRRGLDKGVLSEIAQAGPDQGRAIAAALAAGSGAQLSQINTTERAIRQQAQVVAQQATDRQFGAGAQAASNRLLNAVLLEQKRTNALLHDQPALTGKAVAQAEKNARVTLTAKARAAVPR